MSLKELEPGRRPLYTPEQRLRRDASRWTIVQGVLAPLQLLAFLVSLWLVLRYRRNVRRQRAAAAQLGACATGCAGCPFAKDCSGSKLH